MYSLVSMHVTYKISGLVLMTPKGRGRQKKKQWVILTFLIFMYKMYFVYESTCITYWT